MNDVNGEHAPPLTQSIRAGASVLDPAQLVRIEAVHRGFLFQHLYAVQCLLSATTLKAQTVSVESDEDVEVQLDGTRVYVQVKHRKEALAWDDIESAMARLRSCVPPVPEESATALRVSSSSAMRSRTGLCWKGLLQAIGLGT